MRRHGTNSCYAGGCRRAECRAAHTAEVARYRHDSYAGSLLIPAVGTERRIRALLAIGYSSWDLSRRLGKSKTYLRDFLGRRRDRTMVQRSTADAIARLYDELCMRVPQGPRAERLRRIAARAGHAPPLAWDDDTIDDPHARPDIGPRRSRRDTEVDEAVVLRILNGDASVARTATAAERVETARRWAASGRPLNDLGRLTGWRPDRYAKSPRHAHEGAA